MIRIFSDVIYQRLMDVGDIAHLSQHKNKKPQKSSTYFNNKYGKHKTYLMFYYDFGPTKCVINNVCWLITRGLCMYAVYALFVADNLIRSK